jgi:hypothetical protein
VNLLAKSGSIKYLKILLIGFINRKPLKKLPYNKEIGLNEKVWKV